jgi:glycosyltransferase involved in cell wall biosynthesis
VFRKINLEKLLPIYRNVKCIYSNTIASLEVGVDIKRQLKIPLIAHIHESESLIKYHLKDKEQLDSVDKFIVVSEFSAHNLINNYGIDKKKIIIKHPFSPWLERFYNGEIQISRPERVNNTLTIGTICNGSWQKAPELLAIVAKMFYCRYPDIDCKFMVAGMARDSEAAYKLSYDLKRMNIQDKFVFAGYVQNPLEVHAKIDIFLLHSREDSFPLVAEEAAMMGNAIIGFENATGAAEWIKNEECGILVPYMDLNKMVDAIYTLCTNESLREDMGRRGAQFVKQMWERESSMNGVISEIRNMINR